MYEKAVDGLQLEDEKALLDLEKLSLLASHIPTRGKKTGQAN